MDEYPDMVALADQLTASLTSMAGVLWSYRQALRERGFTDEQADALVEQYHAAWAEAVNRPGDEDAE